MGAHTKKRRGASMKERRKAAGRDVSAAAGSGMPGPGRAEPRIDAGDVCKTLRTSLIRLADELRQRPAAPILGLLREDAREVDALGRAMVDILGQLEQKRGEAGRIRARAPNSALHDWIEEELSLPVSSMAGGSTFKAIGRRYFGDDQHQWENYMGVFATSVAKSLSASIVRNGDRLTKLAKAGDSRRLDGSLHDIIRAAVFYSMNMVSVGRLASTDIVAALASGDARLKSAAIENMRVVVTDVLATALVPALLPALGDDVNQRGDMAARLRGINPATIDAACKKIIDELTPSQQQLPQERAARGRSQ